MREVMFSVFRYGEAAFLKNYIAYNDWYKVYVCFLTFPIQMEKGMDATSIPPPAHRKITIS